MIPILYLVDTLVTPLGGTERQLLSLIDRIDRKRFLPHLALLRPNPDLDTELIHCPFSVLHYGSLGGWDVFRAGGRFVSLCRRHDIQIVHSFFRDATRFGGVWSRAARVPVVVGSRRNMRYLISPGEVGLLRLVAPLTTHTVANSEAAAQEAIRTERLRPDRVSVIANGLDLNRFSLVSDRDRLAARQRWSIPETALVVGSVANLRPIKNLAFLVDAAARLIGRYPDLYFVVLGEGAERPRLEARIRERGIEDRFRLPGLSSNVPAEVQAFDVGVLCSDSESSPNSLIEYLACGRPAVASAVGGAAEILNGQDAGFLYPAGDAARFDACVSALLDDASLRSHMSQSARRHALERFSMDRMVQEHQDLYASLLPSRRNTASSKRR